MQGIHFNVREVLDSKESEESLNLARAKRCSSYLFLTLRPCLQKSLHTHFV